MPVARSRSRIVFAGCLTVFIGVACGIDAVGTGPAGGDEPSSSSGGASSSSGGGASSSGASGGDGASDGPPPGCVASGPEVCEDGIDNDCNGKIDCEDPACSQYVCAKPQTSFTIVSVRAAGASDAGPALDAGVCANGWTNPRVLLDDVRSSASTCACTCGARSGNPCANGTRGASFRNGSSNCNDGTFTLNTDGDCRPLGFGWDPGNGDGPYNEVVMSAPAIVQVACAATATPPAVVDDGALLVCDLAASPTGGIPTACTGGTCVLKPGADRICLLAAGDTATCPAGFPSRAVLAPSFTDGRQCGTCSCTSTASQCSNTQIAFYTNDGCNQGQRTANTGSSCNSIGGSGTPSHYRYEATANGSCIAAAANVAFTGAVTRTTPSTLCCPQ